MPTLLLIRHGRTAANASGTLAGWTPGIGLDDHGAAQAADLGTRLADVPIVAVVASPLQRAQETAAPIAAGAGVEITVEEALGECRYGAWTGRPLAELAKEDLWRVVQRAPSAAAFPPSPEYAAESLAEMSARAVGAVRAIDRRVREEHGDFAVWVAVSHGDVIKAIVADALGAHLDEFQRIVVNPASVSVIHYPQGRPMVLATNGPGIGLAGTLPAPPPPKDAPADPSAGPDAGPAADDGVIGGGAGGVRVGT